MNRLVRILGTIFSIYCGFALTKEEDVLSHGFSHFITALISVVQAWDAKTLSFSLFHSCLFLWRQEILQYTVAVHVSWWQAQRIEDLRLHFLWTQWMQGKKNLMLVSLTLPSDLLSNTHISNKCACKILMTFLKLYFYPFAKEITVWQRRKHVSVLAMQRKRTCLGGILLKETIREKNPLLRT